MLLVHTSCRSQRATFLALSCAILTLNAKAQESANAESASSLEPALGIELRYDDNIFRSAANEQTSLITVLSPSLLASFVPSKHRFELEYNGELASYADSSPDDYDDHEFRAGAYLQLGQRSLLDFVGTYEDSHENRGTGLSEGFDPELDQLLDAPDEYERAQFLGRLTYGATGTRGRLVFEVGQSELEYTNHRDRTRFFDRDDRYGGSIFYYRIMPNTSLLLDLRATEFEYQHDRVLQPSLDSTEYRYLLGATWDVTGKTTGTVKVGYVEKIYADDTRVDFSEPYWELDIRWSPRSYSYFDFATARYPSEVTSVTGDLIDNTTYSITWSHEWSDRVVSHITARDVDQKFRGSATGRLQELTEYGMTLAYEMRRWLTWEFGVDVSSRKSNVDRLNFDGTIIRLGAKLTL